MSDDKFDHVVEKFDRAIEKLSTKDSESDSRLSRIEVLLEQTAQITQENAVTVASMGKEIAVHDVRLEDINTVRADLNGLSINLNNLTTKFDKSEASSSTRWAFIRAGLGVVFAMATIEISIAALLL